MSPRIEFEYGQPVALRLLHEQGRVVASKYYERFYGDTIQVQFTADEGVFYLSDTAGGLLNARLRSRGIGAGELITITKMKVGNPNSARPVTEYVPVRRA
jgi:hypothetical protein